MQWGPLKVIHGINGPSDRAQNTISNLNCSPMFITKNVGPRSAHVRNSSFNFERPQMKSLFIALFCICLAGNVSAQKASKNSSPLSIRLESSGPDGVGKSESRQVAQVLEPGATWVRLHFSDWSLEKGDQIVVSSPKYGTRHILDRKSIEDWHGTSAFFNGEELKIELFSRPGSSSYCEISQVVFGLDDQPVAAKKVFAMAIVALQDCEP